MKLGVREIANVVFKAKSKQKIGPYTFEPGQPVLYIDSAKTSTVEGAATTVYAQGGRGNARLIAWEGEKTLTFTVEDALLSPISFSMLSGAGLLKAKAADNKKVHFHQTSMAVVGADGVIDLRDALNPEEEICATAPIYVMMVDETGDLTGETLKVEIGTYSGTPLAFAAATSNSKCNALKIKSPTTGEGQEQTTTGEGQEQTTPGEGQEQTTPGEGQEQTTPGEGQEQTTPGEGQEQTTTVD